MKLEFFRPGVSFKITTDKLISVDVYNKMLQFEFESSSISISISPIEMDLLAQELKERG